MWKRCRHGNLQHQFMPNPPKRPIRFTRLQWSLLGITEARQWLIVQVRGLTGWCWAACTRHPPSSHREWMKAAHDGTSARAHYSLQRQAMATKVSLVSNDEQCVWEIRKRFQWWCLMMPVSFMFPDAEKCTDTHHAGSKNSTSLLLQ